MNPRSTTCVLCLLIVLVLSGCNNENPFDLDNVIAALPDDTLLNISTYDKSSQVVHPDILLSNDVFYLTLTPYPYSNDSFENPCLYSSTDGLKFLPCVSNPLVPMPAYDHNCDPDIFLDDHQKLCICYLETMRPDSNNVILLQETDPLEFTKSTMINYRIQAGDNIILSPSIVRHQEQYYMFYMYNYDIHYLISSDLRSWDKTDEHDINIEMPETYRSWHVDVFKISDTDEYGMLLHGYETYGYTLTYATSLNLVDWTIQGEVINQYNLTDENARYVYRSTGIVSNNILVIWYSYRTFNNEWKLGLKKIDLITLS